MALVPQVPLQLRDNVLAFPCGNTFDHCDISHYRVVTQEPTLLREQVTMLRIITSKWLVVVLCSSFGIAFGSELSEKVDVGDFAPSYASTKCGGFDDGVAIGKTTCYTCRSGAEPVFYVFVKTRSEPVLKLTKEINTLVAAKQKDKVVGVVNFIGDPQDEKAQAEVRSLGEMQGLKNLSLTLTADGEKFDLDESADVTVIMFENGIIRLRSSAKSSQLNDKTIQMLTRRAKALID